VLADAQKAGVPAALLGYSGGSSLVVKGLVSLRLSDIKAAHEAWLPAYMNATD
jgi:phosphoribosylformylglycinamidine synthase